MKFERRFSPRTPRVCVCVCEEIAVCGSAARVKESESKVSWIKSGFVGRFINPEPEMRLEM